MRVHFLDVGAAEYGDAVLCELGSTRVLIDGAHPGDQVGAGGHPSIPQQLSTFLGGAAGPLHVDLLVVTHGHQDHIGCLPYLVQHKLISAEWALVADPKLGWGRPLDEGERPAAPDARVLSVVAALREEVLSEATDEQTLARFLADAASLEQSYTTMLTTLETAGTHVVRHGRDGADALLKRFRRVGLQILGPSQTQLLLCAEAIARTGADAAAAVADMLARADAPASETDLYRALVHPADAADALARPGPAINLQSIVTRFRYGGRKLLFAGDMQFADPQLGDPRLRHEVELLRARVGKEAPFGLVKLSHHGSDNGLDAQVLGELGATALYGICAGEDSTAHPNPAVLRLLDSERDRLTWVRTDRNGLATIELDGEPKISVDHGQVSDPRPNTPDAETATVPVPQPEVVHVSATGADPVEVVTRVPAGVERVAVTIEVARTGSSERTGEISIGGGRQLPPLLFMTSAQALAANVGESESDRILKAIRAAGLSLYDALPADSEQALALAREQLRQHPEARGVVLLGGYDAVPPRRLDCLPAALRRRLGRTQDADDFIVWSDDAYGDVDDDGIPELPVSRIPDGKSAELVLAALAAGGSPRPDPRQGVRNIARPFAEPIFAALPGGDALVVSEPTTSDETPTLGGDLVYLMLHGDYLDSSRFWGEGTVSNREAVNVTNIPDPGGRVVFTGCCWGALAADQPALRALPGAPPAPKLAGSSIALTFLQRGATAFVGCTGAHYSPTEEPYGYFGGPMHEGFWRALLAGAPPAQALYDAKVEYVRGFPHGRSSPVQQAIEYKILREYTCLGLGW